MADIETGQETETADPEGEKKEGDETEEKESEEEEAEEADDAKDYEPEVRNKPWNTREERAEFFKKKKEVSESEEEDEEKPDISELVKSEVQKFLNPALESIRSQADETEITGFLSKPENAKFRKYEARVRKDAKAYQNVPISKLFKAHYADDAEAPGMDEAKEKAKKNKISGTTIRKTGGNIPDFKNMSDKDFNEFNNRIKRGEKVELE